MSAETDAFSSFPLFCTVCFVVGYIGKNTDALKQPSFGACFVPVDDAKTYKLATLVPTGFDPDMDQICLINPTTLGTDAQYVYMSKEIADAAAEEEGEEPGAFDFLIGWWDASIGVGEEGGEAGNVDVVPGAAFLGLFESLSDITFQFPSPIPSVK